LQDLEDSESPLRVTEAMLHNSQVPVSSLGGTRHASTLVAGRTLAVVRRKASLLQAIEQRIAAFEAAHARGEELLRALVEKRCGIPSELQGVRGFLHSRVHRDGDPVDADKSDFVAFASSFGLPAKHRCVLKLRELAIEATDWWAKATLQEAQNGATPESITMLFGFVGGIYGDRSHSALKEAADILADRLANQVLERALKVQAKDAAVVAGSSMAQPQSAKESAEIIVSEIRQALALGAKTSHPSMAKANSIAVALEEEEKIRYALGALIFAKERFKQDETAAAACGPDEIPKVGPATEMADAIDGQVRGAIAQGAPSYHAYVQEASALAKSLRERDGTRKRLVARQQRLAAAM